MFTMRENRDGTTGMFCSKTGKHIYTETWPYKSMGAGGKPVELCCVNLDLNGSCASSHVESATHNLRKDDPSSLDRTKEEFSNDCISAVDYAKYLNLALAEKPKDEHIHQVKSSFQLKNLSSKKLLNISVPCDELPITTSWGLKLLNLYQQKNFYGEQIVQQKIKNYERFCCSQNDFDSSPRPFSKYKFREKKVYPVVFDYSKYPKHLQSHTYTFNKKQRLERFAAIKTGLNAESRKLLERCNRRLAASLKQMRDGGVKKCTQKRAKHGSVEGRLIIRKMCPTAGSGSVVRKSSPVFIDISCSDDEFPESKDFASPKKDSSYKCTVREKIKLKAILSDRKEIGSSTLRYQNGQISNQLLNISCGVRDCTVELKDVLFNNIVKQNKDFYVTKTNIRVPFLKEFISCLNLKRHKDLVFTFSKHTASPHRGRLYDFSSSHGASKENLLPNSQCLYLKNDSRINLNVPRHVQNKPNSSVKNSFTITSKSFPDISIIPIVDLTDSPQKEDSTFNSNPKFCCYGCGYRCSCSKEAEANLIASQHMRNFHSVTNPVSFLNVYNTASGVVVEAFPGYKCA